MEILAGIFQITTANSTQGKGQKPDVIAIYDRVQCAWIEVRNKLNQI